MVGSVCDMRRSLMGSFGVMRRPELADVMLLATVSLWALNFTVTKYVISLGFEPIAYGVLRFGSAALVFAAFAGWRERTFAMRRRDLAVLAGAALVGIFLNQLSFVYAIKLTTATTVALLFGTLPVMTGIFAYLMGIERLNSRFWMAAALAFGGAAMVALGSGTGVSAQLWGALPGFAASAPRARAPCPACPAGGAGPGPRSPSPRWCGATRPCGSAPSPSRSGRSRCSSSACRS